MHVITTPTGRIGGQLVDLLIADHEPVRVIVRDPARLDPSVRDRVEIVVGSHGDPAVLDEALAGARTLFWLVPPDPRAASAEAHYLTFAEAGAQAIQRQGVGHVVGITSAGHGWSRPAGLLSAAFAMDARLERSGAAYRALSMPFFMENLERNLEAVRERGELSLTYAADRPLALIASADIARVAAGLLTDRSWDGTQVVPVFGPDRLTPVAMADVMSDVLGRPVTYTRMDVADAVAAMAARGLGEQAIRDVSEMLIAVDEGIYDADWAAATPTPTGFRAWCEHILGRR